jgi:ABC-type molybdate transport system substrate-binding protein
MSRTKVLRASPRRLLAALATILVAVGVTVASGASFSAQSANASNTFTAGSMSMSNSKAPGAILSASGMKPGDASTNATGTVVIKNTGTLKGDFSLSRSSLTDTPVSPAISTQINLSITDCGPDQVCGGTNATDDVSKFNTTLSSMSSSIALGNWAVNEQHTYQFVASLPLATPDTYQSASATAAFQWDVA